MRHAFSNLQGETDYLPKWIGKTLLKRDSGGIRNNLDR